MTFDGVVRPRADRDIDEHSLHLATRSLRVAQRFQARVRISFERLAVSPELGFLHPTLNTRLRGVRVWPVRGFPNHLIFYRLAQNRVEILRLLHGSRDAPAALEE